MLLAVKVFWGLEQAYTRNNAAKQHNHRNHNNVAGIDAQWRADLENMQAFARQNSGIRYLLTVIDVSSKYTYVVYVKSKDATSVSAAFREVLNKAAPKKPRRLHKNKGKKFFNSSFYFFLLRKNIKH